MVRRLLLTALLAALAVAPPAAAEGDPAFGLPSGTDPGCLPSDLSCAGPLDACDDLLGPCPAESQAAALGFGDSTEGMDSADGTACRPWDLNMPDTNQSIWETFTLDPDGCLRSFLRRTLDRLPPFEMELAETVDPLPLPSVDTSSVDALPLPSWP